MNTVEASTFVPETAPLLPRRPESLRGAGRAPRGSRPTSRRTPITQVATGLLLAPFALVTAPAAWAPADPEW